MHRSHTSCVSSRRPSVDTLLTLQTLLDPIRGMLEKISFLCMTDGGSIVASVVQEGVSIVIGVGTRVGNDIGAEPYKVFIFPMSVTGIPTAS
ncbi:hypothetical protein ACFX2I_042994 [Malus domestica]